MKVYSLKTEQFVNASLEECWAFFSSPRNLQKITPSDMGFENFTKLVQTVSPLTQYKLMEKKLSII